jgi:Zn-dependent M16 (insulinase) family peptidase
MDLKEYAQVVEFEDVPTEKIDQIKDKFFEVLNRVVEEGVDVERMKTMIKRRKVKHFNSLENSAHGEYAMSFMASFLYGKGDADLFEMLDPVKTLDELNKRDSTYWVDLIKKYLIDSPHVCVLSSPSEEMGEKLEKDEKSRIKKRKKQLGKSKLKQLVEDLKKAEEKNSVRIPDDLLSKFSVPDVNKVHFFDTVTCRNDKEQQSCETNQKLADYVDFKNLPVPFFVQFDRKCINSHFLQL